MNRSVWASPREWAVAPLRGLALVALAVAGFGYALAMVVAATLVVTYPAGVAGSRRLTGLSRALAGRWSGVEIPTLYRPGRAPEPVRRPDGWYEHDAHLYRTPRTPAFLGRLAWLSADPATTRDWLWLVLYGPVGALLAAIPAVGVAGGLIAAIALGGAGRAAGVAAVVLGVAAGPAAVRLHGRWAGRWLGRRERSWWRRSGLSAWTGRSFQAAWHAVALAGLALLGLIPLALLLLGVILAGGFGITMGAQALRPALNRYRRLAAGWGGVTIPQPYLPRPAAPEPDPDGRYRADRHLYKTREAAARAQYFPWLYRDRATWRDFAWLVTAPVVGLLAVIPAVLVGYFFLGLFWPLLWWPLWGLPLGLITGIWIPPWYLWRPAQALVPALAAVPGWLSCLLGLVLGLAGLLLAVPVRRAIVGWSALLLRPTRAAVLQAESDRLAARVERLTETRADAVDAQAAELRRIERDLHDGAQARMVAVGLSLNAIEQLLDRDPAAARELLRQTRDASATALAELRDLVRGIHPPVLAERGLGDAVRAVALDSPLPVDVTVDLPGRPPAPVESAAYFAVIEALANASRHAERVTVDIRHAGGVLRLVVTDDGPGGADPQRGTGLRGIRRRLGTFDGVLALHSPPGGPTVVTMEIPCALSSPRTSSS
ncbi:sensor histidine kinase [Rhizomonospora bruguierae]|uniref:sensor histidine kinase n=1 Tax=Rhizomonospora bruguierae TaxID=1581705 RepID=UPI0020BE5850|nr:histidine kinase [Micromonospora sp. NBRC 107566]